MHDFEQNHHCWSLYSLLKTHLLWIRIGVPILVDSTSCYYFPFQNFSWAMMNPTITRDPLVFAILNKHHCNCFQNDMLDLYLLHQRDNPYIAIVPLLWSTTVITHGHNTTCIWNIVLLWWRHVPNVKLGTTLSNNDSLYMVYDDVLIPKMLIIVTNVSKNIFNILWYILFLHSIDSFFFFFLNF